MVTGQFGDENMDKMVLEEVVSLCRGLIKAQSTSGKEEAAVAVLAKFFWANAFDEVTIDPCGSIIGLVNGGQPGPTLLFDGHIDTVPVEKEADWSHPPFAGEIQKGRLYGRGASDMKGALAAMACAAAQYAKQPKREFKGKICVAGVVQEECFEGVAARRISEALHPDYVVIGEASECKLKIGQRGRAEIKLEVFGKPAHSASPQAGVNAVYQICELIECIRKLPPPRHEILGEGILELTDIKSSPYPGMSVVPEYCVATFDRRLLAGETKEEVLQPLQSLLAQQMAQNPVLQAKASFAVGRETCYTGEGMEAERFFPGWIYSREETYIQKVYSRLQALGLAPQFAYYNFCTNGSHYAGEKAIPTIGYGPSREELAHVVDEYVELDELQRAYKGYGGMIEALLG